MGMIGMAIALLATMFVPKFTGYMTFFLWSAPGAIVGFYIANKVEMVQMPQLVAAYHSLVGLAAVLVGFANFFEIGHIATPFEGMYMHFVETFLGIFIGAVTFTGSVVAFLKLQGTIKGAPLILFPGNGRHWLNLACLVAIGVFQVVYCFVWDNFALQCLLLLGNTLISFFIGWHLIMAIGGADMPVVVSMLNSYSGWATAAAGFMLDNDAMIVTGSLVGSSGAILSYIMCTAMNRSFISVILGGFGGEVSTTSSSSSSSSSSSAKAQEQRPVNSIVSTDLAKLLMGANNIVIIPGYGMAVAKAQYSIAELTDILRKCGKKVVFAIHPVAGRLPGHMNVLLAEAHVPYSIVLEMDEVNPTMDDVDVAIVVGANDIVNPSAMSDPHSPIAGMPIIESFRAKNVIVNKRSMASGYSGIDNPLFYYDNTKMYFGDAKSAFEQLLGEIRTQAASLIKEREQVALDEPGEKTSLVQEEALPADLPPVQLVLGVLKETTPLERMVALIPSTVLALRKRGYGVVVETGAGVESSFPDELYRKCGATIAPSAQQVMKSAKVILKVKPPTPEEMELFTAEHTLISYFYPRQNAENIETMRKRGVTVLAMDMVPRTSKAQKLDALSSMSNLAGYRAVIEAAHRMGRVFTGQITAAGKMPPCTVYVIGAGVAGLAAIGTAKSLGAVVKAFDIRKSVKDQIESMGGEFTPCPTDEDLEDESGYARPPSASYIEAEMRLFREVIPTVDVVISTASIPGKRVIMVTKDMVESMKPGSCIVDLGASSGGNCELCEPGKTICHKGVWIIGNTDLVSRMSTQASSLYSQNIFNLIDMLGKKASDFSIKKEDETIRQFVVCEKGELLFPPPKMAVAVAKKKKAAVAKPAADAKPKDADDGWGEHIVRNLAITMAFLFSTIFLVPFSFCAHLLDFVLAIVVGYHVIWSVTPSLHTPLMSVTNAISGIIVVGGMLELGAPTDFSIKAILGALATALASVNIFGGFYITHRMLEMFN